MTRVQELEDLAIDTLTTVIQRDHSAEHRIAAAKALLEHLRNKKEDNNDSN